MPPTKRITLFAMLFAAGAPAAASAQTGTGTGGTGFVPTPRVVKVACVKGCASKARPRAGSTIRISGSNLSGVTEILFQGARASSDDVTAHVRPRSDRSLTLKVPAKAASGPLTAVAGSVSSASTKPLSILPPAPAPPATGKLTPVPGPRDPGAPQLETAISSNSAFAGSSNGILFAYRVHGSTPVDVQVEVVSQADGSVVQTWTVPGVQPGVVKNVAWKGDMAGGVAPEGRYAFRLTAKTPSGASARSAQAPQGDRDSFDLHHQIFPVRGRHNYGGASARFGAQRNGHTHQGQDVLASCGTRLVAAERGTVKYKQYQSAAGYYLIIHGDESGYDFGYMHLRAPSAFAPGDHVDTGEQIGNVGDTGDATACHLHFEMWSAPGWYSGGKPQDPLAALQAWDAFS
ncbi:MAG: M23 family metallopeptidase [Thermoleophilaceae bacterium]